MRLLVATDKFAGTLTALEACEVIAAGWRSVRPLDEVRTLPMADGGPGTVEAVAAVGAGEVRTSVTVDQRGSPVEAGWLAMSSGQAILGSCSASGLHLVPPAERHPAAVSTTGVGRLVATVASLGFRRIIVGLGGTGTVDGGVGAAIALGAVARRSGGAEVDITGPYDFAAVDSVSAIPELGAEVVAAVDVSNPLLGRAGAAHTFARQKGATETDVDRLESALAHLADVVERCLPGGPWRDLPGAGAGGGLAFGLMAWASASVKGGAHLIGELIGLEDQVARADAVITGEGSLDPQSLAGKAPVHVAELAARHGRPVAVVAGRVESGVADRFDLAVALGDEGLSDPKGSAFRAGARLASNWHP